MEAAIRDGEPAPGVGVLAAALHRKNPVCAGTILEQTGSSSEGRYRLDWNVPSSVQVQQERFYFGK